MMNIRNIRLKLVGASLLVGLALAVGGCAPGQPDSQAAAPPLAGARIGGPFTLTDHHGKVRHDSDYAGRYRLIYFGYSYCPDVCPVDVQKLMRGLAMFEKKDPVRGAKIVPLFISVDPARDTPATLAAFVTRYHPRLIGLSGTPAQTAVVTKAYSVSFRKVDGSTPDNYLMAHSQLAFLMDPDGKPLSLVPLDDISTPDQDEGAPDKVAADLARWVK